MSTYQANLAGLLLACGALFATQRAPEEKKVKTDEGDKKEKKQYAQAYQGTQWHFYVVYTLVMGADWLQGPYLYSLYKDQYGVSAEVVTTLFTTGFVSGAFSATFIGSLADRYGRRLACLLFCAAYSFSCLFTMIPSVPLLFAGRVLGGVSTSLLFSAFESWMVTDFHNHYLSEKGFDLSRTFGRMSTLNSTVAILSGVVSEWLVNVSGTMKAPFAASIGLLGLASLFIYGQWDENYGESGANAKAAKDNSSKLWATLTNKQVLSLGVASTIFEGSMYLFVFFWTPALKAAQTEAGDLPYGVIFASFMAAMMASSLVFNRVTAMKALSYSQLLIGILLVSNLCFFNFIRPRSEQLTFWLFCVFEACVGMYWPCMGYLKGQLVDDGVRAQVYGILRIPLNMFVVASLLLTSDGNANAYVRVFSVCSTLLLASSAAVWLGSLGPNAP